MNYWGYCLFTFSTLAASACSRKAERQTLRHPLHTFSYRAPALLEKGLPRLGVDRGTIHILGLIAYILHSHVAICNKNIPMI